MSVNQWINNGKSAEWKNARFNQCHIDGRIDVEAGLSVSGNIKYGAVQNIEGDNFLLDGSLKCLNSIVSGAFTINMPDGDEDYAIYQLFMKNDGGDITLDFTGSVNGAGFSTITFTDPGQTCGLMWDGFLWDIISTGGGVSGPPTIA